MTNPSEEIRLNLPHIELAAQVYGPADGIPVIALHGWLDNAASFSRLAPKLEGLRIVALDLAGHGHSAHRPLGTDYSLWGYASDALMVAQHLGWQQFSLLGHSMGAITSVMLAAAMPDKVRSLALVDGLLPYTSEADQAPAKLNEALLAKLALASKRKPVYRDIEQAIKARMKGIGAVSYEAAERLAKRGLISVEGGYTWRSDVQLTLPSPLRLTQGQAEAFVQALQCPVALVAAERGMIQVQPNALQLIEGSTIELHRVEGGHHLHLDDEQGAQQVADCFKAMFAAP